MSDRTYPAPKPAINRPEHVAKTPTPHLSQEDEALRRARLATAARAALDTAAVTR